MKLQNYTLRYFVIALLAVIALWASLFYMLIIEEVYDNIDDGLKNSKLLIVREAQTDATILNTPGFGIHQYKIIPLPEGKKYSYDDKFISTFEYMEYDEDDEPVRLLQTTFDANGKPYLLTIRASMVEEDELLEDIMTALIALYVMLAVSIALINHIILQKAWKPFYTMMARLKNFRLGTGENFSAPYSVVSEFKILGQELEEVLKRNEEIYSSQKEFIENASHELQTPLAVSLNKLELFSDKNNLTEEQMHEISSINDTLHRISRLNKSLLVLSKIENRQYTDEQHIDFAALTQQIISDFEDMADYKNVTVSLEVSGALTYRMNKDLATILITNLLKNAIMHNVSGGSVHIKIVNKGITFANSAENGSLNKHAIFSRFYKDSENRKSTGLGLAIVKSIAVMYKLQYNYNYNNQHIFEINFHNCHFSRLFPDSLLIFAV